MGRFMHLDLNFHAYLMLMALNPRMQKIANETQLMIRIFAIRRSGHEAAMLDKIHAQHNEIVMALRERQPERAMRILSEHIQDTLARTWLNSTPGTAHGDKFQRLTCRFSL